MYLNNIKIERGDFTQFLYKCNKDAKQGSKVSSDEEDCSKIFHLKEFK